MKNILIFSHAMEIGGAEMALLGLLESIDTTKYQVDLFLMRHEGELMKYIPKGINILPENKKYAAMMISNKSVLKGGMIDIFLARLLGKIKAKRKVKQLGFNNNYEIAIEYSHKYTFKLMPRICEKVYDVAISFLTPHYFAANKVLAKKKIAWIHSDYQTIELDIASELKMWSNYNLIASISNKVTDSFIKVFPTLKDRIFLMENIMPMSYMNHQMDAFLVDKEMPDDGSVRILSIGRFASPKNFDNVPEICKLIVGKGVKVKWYLIGFGLDESLIKSKIRETGMQDYVIILGKKENPYPYIKRCDIYIQPSRYEGKSVAVREAQILNKPVVITNYATASSQLKDGYDGIIVPLNNNDCAEGIVKLILDKSLQHSLIENTKREDYTNKAEIGKLYRFIG